MSGDTSRRYLTIQRRAWAVYFVSTVYLAIKFERIGFVYFLLTELGVEKSKYELWGSTFFCLFMTLYVFLPHAWWILIIESIILEDVLQFGVVAGILFLRTFLYEFYVALPLLVSLIGSNITIIARLMFCLVYLHVVYSLPHN